ncbi:MAG: hypothetical protein AB7G17_09895 [Phycisphaerales bacterium]
MARRSVMAAVAAGCTACAGVFAQSEPVGVKHEIMLRDLRVSVGTLVRADEEGAEWVEEGGVRRRAGANELLGVAPSLAPMVSADTALELMGVQVGATGIVETRDGERYPGERLGEEAEGEETLVWRHPSFGRMSFSLDDVRRAGFDTPTRERIERRVWSGSTKDVAWLANGDALEGYLVGIGERVVLQTDGGGEASAPMDRVSGIALAGARKSARGVRYWFEDGTVCTAASATSAGAGWTVIALKGGQTIRMPLSAVRAMVMDTAVVAPLSSLAPPSVAPVGDRAVLDGVRVLESSTTPAWNAYDIELGGPLSATWEMPAGALKFSALVEMPLATRPWGDCEVAVLVDGVEVWKARLWGGEPAARVGVSTAGRRLTVEVRPGAQGGVNDRPVLRRAIVVVGEPEA